MPNYKKGNYRIMDYELIFEQCNMQEKQLFKGTSPIYKSRKCKICGAHGKNVKFHPCGNREYICSKCKKSQEKGSTGSEGKVNISRGKKFGESVFDRAPEDFVQDSNISELIEASDELLKRVDVGSYTVVDDHLEFTIDTEFTQNVDEDAKTYLENYFNQFMNIPVTVTVIAEEEGFATCEVRPA